MFHVFYDRGKVSRYNKISLRTKYYIQCVILFSSLGFKRKTCTLIFHLLSDIIEQSSSLLEATEINRGTGGRAVDTSSATNRISSLQCFLLIFFIDPFLHTTNVKRSVEQSINLAYVYDPFLRLMNAKSSFRNSPAASMESSGEDATFIATSDRHCMGSPSEYFSLRTFSSDDVGMEACFFNSDLCRLSFLELRRSCLMKLGAEFSESTVARRCVLRRWLLLVWIMFLLQPRSMVLSVQSLSYMIRCIVVKDLAREARWSGAFILLCWSCVLMMWRSFSCVWWWDVKIMSNVVFVSVCYRYSYFLYTS